MKLYARHRLDIRPSHLLVGIGAIGSVRPDRAALELERRWSPQGHALACLSVRSGFHALLGALDLAPGSEVLFSAVTHPDMPRLAEHHSLRVLPIDLDRETLAPRPELVLRALTPRTRMVVVAHLFGGRVDLESIAAICRRHGLLLVEDCAQAFTGPGDTGDPQADVSMFSFGSLKTATALGGAVLTVRDERLLGRMRAVQATWPVQPRMSHLKRLAQMGAFVALTRPVPYGLLARICAARQVDFDRLVNSSARAFPSSHTAALVARLEQRPSAPLLRLIAHRLRHFDTRRLAARASAGETLAAMLPRDLLVGGHALDHTHWLFPVSTERAAELITAARAAGFDAARRASSVSAIAAPPDRPDLQPHEAAEVMSRLVFLPAYPELPDGSLERLAQALESEVGNSTHHSHNALLLKGEGVLHHA
jgi:perosamine synthetase